jgi:hypothetical protein
MDKELIAGLSNLSESLDRIAEVLRKKEEPKSATAMALKMGEFDKQITEMSKSIVSIKEDTKKLLDQQDTILKILKKTDKDVKAQQQKVKEMPKEQTAVKLSRERSEDKQQDKVKTLPADTTTQKVAKDKKDERVDKKKSFFGDMDTSKIKDGISTILLIATGVVAIGLALKLIGKVDFLSVIALSVALPLIAIAFERIARVNLDRKKVPDMILALVGFSTAIALSSFILSKVRPIGLFQAFSSVMIAGVFAMIAPNLGKLLNGLKDVNFLTALKAVIFLPVILASVSMAIMLSSKFLANVKPIGLFQAFSAIMIAGVFATVAFGLGKLLSGFKGLNPMTAVIASALLPIVLVAVSFAIMMSSVFLSNVKPIGLFQAISSILIAAVFAVVSYGIGKMISAFKGVNPLVAGIAALVMPILFVALSFAIMKSSYFLANVRPIGLFQAFSSILIAVTFVVLSYAVAKILPSFRRVSLMDAAKAALMMPLIFTALSVAIMLSSYPLSKVKPIGLFQFLTSVAISVLFVVQSYLFVQLVKILKNVSVSDIVKTGVKLIAISTIVFTAGFIISKMPDVGLLKILGVVLFTTGLVAISKIFEVLVKSTRKFTVGDIVKEGLKVILMVGVLVASAFLISKIKIDLGKSFQLVVFTVALALTVTIIDVLFKSTRKFTVGDIIKEGLKVILMVGVLAASSFLINKMKIDLGKSFQLVVFTVALALTVTIMAGVFKVVSKLGVANILKGAIAIVAIAATIMISSILISMGKYTKYPSFKWSLSIALTLGIFGIAAVLLGTQAMNPMFYAGLGVIVLIAGVIVLTSFILSTGKYNKYPSLAWSLGVGAGLAAFGLGAVLLGTQVFNPFFYAGLGMILVVAGTVVATSYILNSGKYDKYPSLAWVGPTVLIIGTFGLLAVGLGIVSPLLLLGLPSLIAIAGTIWLIDKIFSNGKFDKYPPKDWVNSSILIIGKFALAAIVLAFALPLIILGGVSILAVAGIIWVIDKVFSKGEYKKWPSDKWINGVSHVIAKFSKLLQTVRRELGFGDLVLGAIKLLGTVYTIKLMDDVLKKGEYIKYPSRKWNDGVSYTIRTFMDLMKDKSFLTVIGERIGSFLGGGLDDIAGVIIKIDKKLAQGEYKKYPTSEWNKGMSAALSSVMTLMQNNSILSSIGNKIGDVFGAGLTGTAKTILEVDRILSQGTYTKFPSSDWSQNVLNVLMAFKSAGSGGGVVSSIVSAAGGAISAGIDFISGLFGGEKTETVSSSGRGLVEIAEDVKNVSLKISSGKYDVFPSQLWLSSILNTFSNFKLISNLTSKLDTVSILLVSDAIVLTSLKISSGSYTKYPDSKWISSISELLTSFSKIITDLGKNSISTFLGLAQMERLTMSILKVDKSFSLGKFQKYPKDSWIKNVTKTFLDFSSLLNNINKNISLPSLYLGQAKIKSIIDFILFIDKKLEIGKYKKWPNDNWIKKTTSSILSYGDSIINVDKKYPISNIFTGIYKGKMIVEMILWVDKKLDSGKYKKWPNDNWIKKTINSILQYGQMIVQSDNQFKLANLISGILKVRMIANTIIWVDKTIDKGVYKKWPEKNWLTKTSNAILSFGSLAVEVDKRFSLMRLILGLKKVKDISDTIRYVSLTLDKGKYTKYPSLEWATAVPRAISQFMLLPFKGLIGSALDSVLGPSEGDKKSQLGKIVDLMLYVDKKFQAGNWSKFPTVQWVNGTVLALQKFRDIVGLLSFSSLKDKVFSYFGVKSPIVSAVSNIEKLAHSFSKLSSAMKSFSDSIKQIDNEKLAAIRSLSSNVVMLSLMDPEQFDQMMNKLEERAGIFNDLIKDFEYKKEEAQKTPGSAVGQNNKTTKAAPMKLDTKELSQKMDVMNAILGDIASVVGSRGTLKTYLNKIKDDTTIGGGSNTITNKSDSRLKKIIKKLGVSNSGINIYLFSYNFDPNTLYQGVIAQELLNTEFESAVHIDKNGIYSVDYSKIDVEFKKTFL